ncbi:MAG TPA: 30S ribosomal protein S20 [Candidatus Dormibacteraeota bacterium]|nr:30S ribosomal protein S20 [Candidatus Dormibacteraeota bacterium]
MANLKSAIKRVRTNDTKRLLNQSFKSEMRSHIKQVETLVEAKDVENAKKAFQEASRKIDKTVQKGIIHKNNGNRQKSRLAKKIKSLGA